MEQDQRRATTALGWAVYGSITVGVLGVIASLLAFAQAGGTGAGAGLVSSALAFGLLANALLR